MRLRRARGASISQRAADRTVTPARPPADVGANEGSGAIELSPAGGTLLALCSFMRWTSCVAGLLFALLASTAQAQAEDWKPIQVGDGVSYEIEMGSVASGKYQFRMSSPAQLEDVLGRFGARTAAITRQTRDINLPPDMLSAPDALFKEAASMARAMGPDLRFFGPPSLGTAYDRFSFNDGKRLVSLSISDPGPTSGIDPLVELEIKTRSGGQWVVARRAYVQFARKGEDDLQRERELGRPFIGSLASVWTEARLIVERGTRKGRPRTVSHRTYTAMTKPGQWFGVTSDGGRSSYVLRSRDPVTQQTADVRVTRPQAERLFLLAASKRYRTKLPSSHPDFNAKVRRFDDVPTSILQEAGLHVVVDKRGRAYLRRGRAGVDRGKLRERGLTYVAPRGQRSGYLRHLPARSAPRASRP
jgi:hypothetical protein